MPTINSVNTSPVQYNVQVGSTNGTTDNIVPSTSGFILTSNGGSAAPTFQIAGTSSISITGDLGSTLTGSSFTINGGTTGLETTGSGTTLAFTGTLAVGSGGTGASTLTGVLTGNGTSAVTANTVTQHGIVIGGASNAVTSLGSATNGQLAIGSTGANPVLAALTSSGSTITVTNGAGSINLDVAGSVATTYSEDTGSAAPSAGTLHVNGDDLNINTSGSGSTIVVALDNAITLGSLTPIAAFSPALTLTTGDANITAGNIGLPAVASDFSEGAIIFAGQASIFYDNSNHNWCVSPGGFGSASITGTQNSIFGYSTAASLNFGSSNTALGNLALTGAGVDAPSTADQNTAVGYLSLTALLSGSNNSALGYNSGSAFVGAESNNIVIGSVGVAADSGVTRIGTNGTHTSCYVAGIDGVDVGSVATIVTEASDQLGTAVLTAGANITITPGANTITIAASATAFTWTDVTGGSATLEAQNGYLADSASLTTFTMPTDSAIGDTIKVVGLGSGGWTIIYSTGQFIKFGSVATTADTGSLSSTLTNDSIELICTTASGTAPIFTVVSSVGNLSYV